MVTNVNGWTNRRSDGKPDPCITSCMKQAQQKPTMKTYDKKTYVSKFETYARSSNIRGDIKKF